MRAQEVAAGMLHDDRGTELVEYAVMVALVVGGTIIALGTLLAALIGRNQELINVIFGS